MINNRKVFRILCLVLAFALATAGGIFAWGYTQFGQPGPLKKSTTVIVPRGAGVERIAQVLHQAGVIASPLIFRAGVRLMRADTDLRAGEFSFVAKMSSRDVIAHLRSGKTVVRRFTVPEGLTTAEIMTQLNRVDGLIGSTIDAGPVSEGALLPETYHFSYGDHRASLVQRMRKGMQAAIQRLWAKRAQGLPLRTMQEALILASIVEKETGVPEERSRVAGVFINRLRLGMRLQSDPTVVYAVTGGAGSLNRALTRKDLEIESPYNSYLHKGLPPGPICNPGHATIAAVLNPETTDDLYFVADGKGGHAFAKTLKEHNRNVARYRLLLKQQKQKNRKP